MSCQSSNIINPLPVVQVGVSEAEIHFDTPPAIIIPFAMHTAVLIFLHLLSIVIATQILPELEAVSDNPRVTIHCQGVVKLAKGWPVQLCWILSNIVGTTLFAVELVFLTFVRFYPVDEVRSNRLHAGTATLLIAALMTVLSIPIIYVSARSVSKQKIRLHEQRLRGARELLDSINQTSVAPSLRNLEAAYQTSGGFEKIRDTEV